MGRDSSVGVEIRYELDDPADRIQAGARFSALVLTGPGTSPLPSSCRMSTGGKEAG